MAQDEGESQDQRQRGRPRRPASDDPVAELIRTRREALELSYQALAARVDVSPSHIFHIERGDKVPSEDVAVRIARAIGEDVELFRSWARARGRADLATTMQAAELLDQRLAQRGIRLRPGQRAFAPVDERRTRIVGKSETVGGQMFSIRAGQEFGFKERARSLDDREASSLASQGSEPSPHRIRIPIVPAGEEPGDGAVAGNSDMLRVRVDELGVIERIDRPFAYPLTPETVARVEDLPVGGYAVITRRLLRRDGDTVYAVRLEGRVVLSRVMWHRLQLLVLPRPGAPEQFRMLGAPDEAALARHIVGTMVAVHFPG